MDAASESNDFNMEEEEDEFNTSALSRLSTADTEDTEDNQSLDRIRMLMLNYYGNEGPEDEEEDDEAKKNDLDGDGFDVNVYLQSMLRTETLNSLLTQSAKLKKETQTLDSDMQNMVYENYNKFIRATETIKKMKDNVSVIESELDDLMDEMEQLESTSEVVDANLAPNRDKIENMLSLQGLIKKLEFLFELPMRLKRSIELEAYVQAVKYYNTANLILEKYAHVLSFGSIHKESIAIMAGLKDLMQNKLKEGQQTPSGMADLTRLLLEMEEPPKDMMNTFVEWTRGKLNDSIERIGAVAKAGGVEIWDQTNALVDLFSQFVADFRVLFTSNPSIADEVAEGLNADSVLMNFTKEVFQSYFTNLRPYFVSFPLPDNLKEDESLGLTPKFIEGAFGNEANTSGMESFDGAKESGISDGVNSDAEAETRSQGTSAERGGEECSFDGFIDDLVRFRGCLTGTNTSVRAARLHDRVAEIIEEAVRTQITKLFTSVQTTILCRFGAVNDALRESELGDGASPGGEGEEAAAEAEPEGGTGNTGNPFSNSEEPQGTTTGNPFTSAGGETSGSGAKARVRSSPSFLSNTLSSLILSDVEYALRNIKILLERCSNKERLLTDMEEVFANLVQGQLHHLFSWLCSTIEDYCDGVGAMVENVARTPSAMLVMAVAINDLAQNGVTRSASVMMECLPLNSATDQESAFSGNTMFDVGGLMNTLTGSSSKLLEHFALLQARNISKDVRRSILAQNWLTSKEVSRVSPAMVELAAASADVGKEVATVLGEHSTFAFRDDWSKHEVSVRYGNEGGTQGMEGAIDRIFSQKITVFGKIEFASESVLGGVLKIILKAMSETVRTQTFSKRGFQQIEVDANYVQNVLSQFVGVGQQEILTQLSKEVMGSASERCLNPEHLELETIRETVLGCL